MVLFAAASVFAGGQQEAQVEEQSGVSVFVSIVPQTYLVEKIGGDRLDVDVLVPPGKSPATYEPTPNQMAALSGADVLFAIGVPFENAFLPTVKNSLKELKIVDTSAGIHRRSMDVHHHEEEHHDEEAHEHGDAALDPHVWMSPVLAKVLAQNIFDTLVEIDPAGRDVYESGLNSLFEELDGLHSRISSELAPFEGSTLFIFHPALGYFADEYGLKQVAIEAGGKEPSAAELTEIIEHARAEGVEVIFVQPEFSKESASVIAEAIGGQVVGLNPLNPDYINNLNSIAAAVRVSYE